MNHLRNVMLSILAVVGVALALPGIAYAQVSKNYGLSVTSVVPITSPSSEITLVATFKNLSPKNANSSFNSLRLLAPVGVVINTTAGATTPAPTAITAGEIRYENLSPVGKDASFVITFKATFTTAACTQMWNPGPDDDVWTGSQINSGNPFTKVVNASYPSTTTQTGTPSVALAITYAPGASSGSVVAGAPGYAATATVTGACSPADALVTFPGSSNVTVTPAAPTTNSSGVANFTATFGSTGPASLTASVLGATSNTLNFTVYDGVLNCGQPLNTAFTMPGGVVPITEVGYAAGSRGAYNKDGSLCVPVNYDFSNDIATTNSARLRWDTTSQPGAAFIYTMTWQDEVPDLTAGVPTRRTRVAWQFDPTTGVPLFKVYGVACVGSSLPAAYGTLTVGIDNSQTTITVTGATPPAVPFPAAIGSERIWVTAVVGSNWTVVRGTGNLGADAATHGSGANVMSTPLPIDRNPYLPGTTSGSPNNPYYLKQAQMCIADEGWVAVGGGKVRFTTTVFDVGDGFVDRDL